MAISLCADTFVSSISKGIQERKLNVKFIMLISLSFAFFQTLMPYIGYMISSTFSYKIIKIGNIISFIILTILGINMMKEENEVDSSLKIRDIILLSISVSLDALAIGVTFSFLNVMIRKALIIIFITTFITSFIGVILGNIIGNKYNKKALTIGGLVLISIGIKILLF